MKDLLNDIKTGEFKQVYLLYGEEAYLSSQYRDRLISALLPGDPGMNLTIFSGDKIREGEVIDLAETLPFFAERRVIRIDHSGFFKNAPELLPDYIRSMPDYLSLVFTEDEVDRRSRMYKAVGAVGRCVEFPVQTEATLSAWLLRMLDKEQLKIRRADMDYLLMRTGSDMHRILTEVDKLIHYCAGSGEITRADIDAVTTRLPEDRVFDMISAMTAHRQKDAMDLYADLLSLREPPMKTLHLIGLQYNRLLLIKELAEQGLGDTAIAQKAGMPPFAVRKNRGLLRSFTEEQLVMAVAACVEADEDIKNGRLGDRLAVELLIIKLSA